MAGTRCWRKMADKLFWFTAAVEGVFNVIVTTCCTTHYLSHLAGEIAVLAFSRVLDRSHS